MVVIYLCFVNRKHYIVLKILFVFYWFVAIALDCTSISVLVILSRSCWKSLIVCMLTPLRTWPVLILLYVWNIMYYNEILHLLIIILYSLSYYFITMQYGFTTLERQYPIVVFEFHYCNVGYIIWKPIIFFLSVCFVLFVFLCCHQDICIIWHAGKLCFISWI